MPDSHSERDLNPSYPRCLLQHDWISVTGWEGQAEPKGDSDNSVSEDRRLEAVGGLPVCTEHYRAVVHLSACYDQTGRMPRHTYDVEMNVVGTSSALTGIGPVLPPPIMMFVLSIKPKAEVIGYPSSHNPEAGKGSHATDGSWQQRP